MTELQGQHVLVVGMGRSGLAALDLLRRQGATVVATDSNESGAWREALAGMGIEFVPQEQALNARFDRIVTSPGVAIDAPLVVAAKQRGIPVTGEVELAGWSLQGPIIGITGSNGKTTTTALTQHMLVECGIASQVGGNIGLPPSAMVATARPDQWNVLELSSFQTETLERFRPKITAILNLTPDHLDRHHTMEAYGAAKRRLIEVQDSQGYAILNAADAFCRECARHTPARVMWFSSRQEVEQGACIREETIHILGQPVLPVADVPLPGRHNLENVLAAGLAAALAGAPAPGIGVAVRNFAGVEHRLQFVRELNGVRYYNDSKATNVDATLKALAAFPGRLWVVLGGKDKGSDYAPLREPLREKAHAALLIGAAAPLIAEQLGNSVPLEQCGTIQQAVKLASERATAGDIVLLAPACASFDQFQNFEHRGQVFTQLVRDLPERRK